MHRVIIQPRFFTWQNVARSLLAEKIAPEQVLWQEVGADQPLLIGSNDSAADSPTPVDATHQAKPVRVSKTFLDMAEDVACHRDPDRWALLYRVLWRMTHGETNLLHLEIDDDIRQMVLMRRQVGFDVQRMIGFTRFHQIQLEGRDGQEYLIAWYKPDHHIFHRAAGAFVHRLGSLPWSIFTPDGSAHYNGQRLSWGPGIAKSPGGTDDLVALWQTYYTSVFIQSRANQPAMVRNLPRRFWPSLPEIKTLD